VLLLEELSASLWDSKGERTPETFAWFLLYAPSPFADFNLYFCTLLNHNGELDRIFEFSESI
jgi:hypothetical protein